MFQSWGSSSRPRHPQYLADLRHGVVGGVPLDVGSRVDPHGAELEHVDDDPALTHSLLTEVDRAGARDLHDGGDRRVQRRHHEKGERRHGGVEDALHDAGLAPHQGPAQTQERIAPDVIDVAAVHGRGELEEPGQHVDLDRGVLAGAEDVDHVGLTRHTEGDDDAVDPLLGQHHAQHAHPTEQRERETGTVDLVDEADRAQTVFGVLLEASPPSWC